MGQTNPSTMLRDSGYSYSWQRPGRQKEISAAFRGFLLLGLLLVCASGSSSTIKLAQRQASLDSAGQDHVIWVAQALTRMETIKPGLTRKDLLKAFATEGGLSTGLQRTFVSRDCPYFKVDVDFEPVGRPSRDADGRGTVVEDARDIILGISRPYLQFTHAD